MISFIAPCFNRPALLRRMLESLVNQTNQDFELLLMDDNSSKPEVDEIAHEYFPKIAGIYAKTKVTPEERPLRCRSAIIVNMLLPHAKGDIIGYLSDDKETRPDLVELVTTWFRENQFKSAGYVGVGYRFLNWKTGEPQEPPQGFTGTREWVSQLNPQGLIRVKIPYDRPDGANYGKPIHKVFSVLDSVQFFHRREFSVYWNEDHMLGADAEAMQNIANRVGLVFPIGDVTEPVVCSNLNNSSLTVTQNVLQSVKVLSSC